MLEKGIGMLSRTFAEIPQELIDVLQVGLLNPFLQIRRYAEKNTLLVILNREHHDRLLLQLRCALRLACLVFEGAESLVNCLP